MTRCPFLPCAPNPTTGFFFLLPRAKVDRTPDSVEEAAKLVISAGLIQPEEAQARFRTLADAAWANGVALRIEALEPSPDGQPARSSRTAASRSKR